MFCVSLRSFFIFILLYGQAQYVRSVGFLNRASEWNRFTRRMAGCCLRLSIFLCDFSHLCLSLDYQVTFLPSLTLSPCIITSLARSTWDSLYWRRRRERTHTPSPLGVCVWKERKKQQQQHNPSPFRLLLTFFFDLFNIVLLWMCPLLRA